MVSPANRESWRLHLERVRTQLVADFPDKPPEWAEVEAHRIMRSEWGPEPRREGWAMSWKMLSSLLAVFVKDVAEGKHGETLERLYWKAAGKKTLIAIALAAAYGFAEVVLHIFQSCAPECATPEAIEVFARWISWGPHLVAFLVAVGLYDGAVRLEAPKRPRDAAG
jgi:putative copper export protein